MCEFCIKHGEGEKWYLQAKNYSEELLNDLRRREFIADFFARPESLRRDVKRLERLDKAPSFFRRIISRRVSNDQKKVHFGQVVPIEDVEHIFDFMTSIVRVACLCRYITTGSHQRYCYGISLAPKGGQFGEIIRKAGADYLLGPDTEGLESLSKEEAVAALQEHEQEGLCHTVWTFIPPFIGGICNCNQSECLAMRVSVAHKTPVLFRAEYVARVTLDLCNGCQKCKRMCQFGAIDFGSAQKKVDIDPRRCYGCGICRAFCSKNAISLHSRQSVPVAANIW